MQVTVSVGFTEVRHQDTPNVAFARADQAVYRAKHQGRNQVLSHESLVRSGLLTDNGQHIGDENVRALVPKPEPAFTWSFPSLMPKCQSAPEALVPEPLLNQWVAKMFQPALRRDEHLNQVS